MTISNKLLNVIIIGLYIITLFLGNSNFLGFIDVGDIINYIIVIIPAFIILLVLINNRKNIGQLFNNRRGAILSVVFIVWSIITSIIGINMGIQNIKAMIHFGLVLLLILVFSQVKLDPEQKEKLKKHIFISFGITLVYGILEYIFKFNLDTYSNGKYPGMNGRIYSTFYIATLYDKYIAMMSAFICFEIQQIKNNQKLKYALWLILFLSGICVALTFSRTGLLLYLMDLFLLLIIIVYRKRYKEILLILFIVISMFFIPGVKYSFESSLNVVYSIFNLDKISDKNIAKEAEKKIKDDKEHDERYLDQSLEFRDYYKKIGKEIIHEYPLYGIGIGNYSYIYNNQNIKDYLDEDDFIVVKYMYPHSSYVQLGAETGYIGIILFYLSVLAIFIPSLLRNNKIKNIFLMYVLVQFFAISYVEGVIYAKQYIYLFAIVFSLYINYNDLKIIKSDKVTFLLLHLGYGGIETSTINTANALCDKYDIEIVSFYRLSSNQSNKLNKKIKVKYLYDGEPNRDDFKKYLKGHKYIKTFREGIKAINILIKKKLLVIRAIIDNDSKYIVSTRWEFSILLSRYGNRNSIKIAQEHHYHNNNQKYIKVISNKYNNIDYLCALTKTLEEDYKKFLVNNKHTKVILIPNMITEIPKVNSSLKEKNIITISRLDYGKRNDEIIRAFSKIKEKEWKLYIIGNGQEYNSLSNLVKKLDLEDRVLLTGYKDKKEIEKYMLKSSIFLMASVSEGLPMVLLEAMSYGIPCIAYETDSGISDIIENGKNGYIIKERNEDEYIKKIEGVIQNDNHRKELGRYAKQSVNKFSKEEITKIWEKILSQGE